MAITAKSSERPDCRPDKIWESYFALDVDGQTKTSISGGGTWRRGTGCRSGVLAGQIRCHDGAGVDIESSFRSPIISAVRLVLVTEVLLWRIYCGNEKWDVDFVFRYKRVGRSVQHIGHGFRTSASSASSSSMSWLTPPSSNYIPRSRSNVW